MESVKDAIKSIFSKAESGEVISSNHVSQIDEHYDKRTAANLREKEAAEKRNRLEAARAKLQEHLQRSAQRGRHDYQEPNPIEQ